MANEQQSKKLREGAEEWNRWRSEHRDERPNLRGANLKDARLGRADLSEADLGGADPSRANLSSAKLTGANLSGVNLGGADLSEAILAFANLRRANLSGANLTCANLGAANLAQTNLKGADLGKSLIGHTILVATDISSVKGLASVEDVAPCSIGIDTLYASKGQIPEVFLRGCGLPEEFITYARSLVGKAMEFYSCFISYSH